MITLTTTATMGKSFAVKREKDGHDEKVVAHLKFSGAYISRDEIDEILKRPIGWATAALFDDFGAPHGHWVIALEPVMPLLPLSLSGSVRGGDKPSDPVLVLRTAALTGVQITLSKLGGELAGSIAWEAAGDEVEDIAELLGKECGFRVVLSDGGQQDLLLVQASQAAPPVHATRARDEVEYSTRASDGTVSSASQAMRLLQDGWELCGAEPNYWLRCDGIDGTRPVWLNAARSCLKRHLVPIATEADEYGRWVIGPKVAA